MGTTMRSLLAFVTLLAVASYALPVQRLVSSPPAQRGVELLGYLANASAPTCTAAGQPDLCNQACESICRGFKPGFKVAGCINEKYCSATPSWANGSVCSCSSPA